MRDLCLFCPGFACRTIVGMAKHHIPKTPDEVWEYVEAESGDPRAVPPAAEEAAMHLAGGARSDIDGLSDLYPIAQRTLDDEEPEVFGETVEPGDDEELDVADLLVAQHYLTRSDED
jgi:hypothetical protein